MYQAIYYDYSSGITYLRDDSKPDWLSFKYSPTYYKRVKQKTSNSLPILTGGWAVPVKKYDKTDPDLLEKDINKELVVLRDLYYEYDDVLPKNHRICFLDIETELGGPITRQYLQESPMPLTSIAIIDKTLKQKICFIVDKSKEIEEINEKERIIIPCIDEIDLIEKFLNKWEEIDPTIVIGWNSEYFDIPYLYYRINRLLGINKANCLSPIKKVNIYDGKELSVRLGGINHLDYMLLKKKYEYKQEPSYKLGAVGERYVGLGKIEYEGNLNQLFKNNKNKFIDYNLRDVEILEKLDEKFKYIELTILISHICNTPYDQIYYNTVLGEGAILKYLKRKNIVSPNKPTTHNPSRKIKEETYAGGYLLEPVPGLYFDVVDLDFTSLYPSIIKSLNLGVETLIGRIVVNNNYEQNHTLEKLKQRNPEEIIKIERLNKKNYTLESTEVKLKKLIEIIEENKYTISASGAIFRTDVRSVSASVLEGWFEKREYYRGLKKKAGKEQNWDNFKLYDGFQLAFKILQNALYGTYAKNVWRYTDGYLICSCAITNSGQRLDIESINFVNKKLNEEFNTNEKYVKLADTDSMYIELKSIIDKKYGNVQGKERNDRILEIMQNIQKDANDNLKVLCKELFNLPENKFFQLKQEVIATSLLATGKRRYGMFITNKEGVSIPPDHDDALDLKGLEVMKSNMNLIFKEFGENFIKEILFGKTKEQLDQSIINFKKSLKNIDPIKLGKPTGVSFIQKCIKRPPSLGEIFSELNLNTKENSKAAIYYNDLIKFNKLDHQYESIIEGDKIYVINLKSNPYNINVIGLPNNKIPEKVDKLIQEYIDIELIFESMIGKKLRELYKDLDWEFPSLNEKVSKFFHFM